MTMPKIALVTGGARGIGLGISLALAKEGANIAILGTRPEDQVQQALDDIRELGVKDCYCQGSIASAQDRIRALDTFEDAFGAPINFLVNNAGVAPRQRADILDATEKASRNPVINLRDLFLTGRRKQNDKARKQNPEFRGGVAILTVRQQSRPPAANTHFIGRRQHGDPSSGCQTRRVRINVYEIRPNHQTDMRRS